MVKPARIFSSLGLLLMAIALAVLLRILHLGSRELWYDEVLSLLLTTGQKTAYQTPRSLPLPLGDYTALLQLPLEESLGDIVATVAQFLRGLTGEPHPPLFFLGQHLWLRLWGNGVAALRSLNALYSVGAIALAYGIGRQLLNARAGLIFAALLGLNPYYLFHSLNVRMYGPLVFWAMLTTWALLQIIALNQGETQGLTRLKLLWMGLFVGAMVGGLMTFYLFFYYILALAALVLWLDRRHSLAHAGRFILAGCLTLPWIAWGTTQQMRNADFDRFSTPLGFWATLGQHFSDTVQTLGIQLVLGDWVTSLPPSFLPVAGAVAIVFFVGMIASLWQWQQRQLLGVALILALLPLGLALVADVVGGKFTLGFGWGRSLIVILPGSLLLLTLWLAHLPPHLARMPLIIVLLFYLTMGVGDFSLRSRRMFHELAAMIPGEPVPTLIALNSKAWGHVMRLAYYLPSDLPLDLLAERPADLAASLAAAVENTAYPRVIWLESHAPLWDAPATLEEEEAIAQAVKAVLSQNYHPIATQALSGTMDLDQFTVSLYQQR
ncbi:glycosyltransferase family 39 protein [Spirulina sp. CCNP1310]|uniref:glycosyltransferase family 39 protein n=1 Tax=Spirulina sp. CCNP1310 TaxID=3110249 RepID=UPI002B1FE1AD|nr:glycosyltransferase family 39 protein [Spirulina sp. CCNP1310]MEA5418950.1 glycosyltransferase family 39 protein [Spirulina sp. CCNP1310]